MQRIADRSAWLSVSASILRDRWKYEVFESAFTQLSERLGVLSNKRLKLAAPRVQGRIAVVITRVVRRSLGAVR